MMWRFKDITFNTTNGLSSRLSNFGMYDLSTAVKIGGDKSGGDSGSDEKPNVYCASRGKWLVLGVGNDIHVFDLAVGIEHKSNFTFAEDGSVLAIEFLPDDDIFVVFSSSGCVALCVPSVNFFTEEKCFTFLSNCSVSITSQPQKWVICALEIDGCAHFLQMLKPLKKDEHAYALQHLFSSDRLEHSHVVSAGNAFGFFPRRKGKRVKVFPINCDTKGVFSDWFTLREDVNVVRNVGSFIVVLTSKNEFIFYDHSLIQLYKFPLHFADGECVMDFQFLDVPIFCDFASDVRVLFQVKADGKTEFALKSLDSTASLFNARSADQLVLVPHATPGDDSCIVYVEGFPKSEPHSILVRFISEAQPSLRLKRLLDFDRFDDALEFAKKHDLPLDIVYTALIRKCQDQIQNNSDYEESIFEDLMKYLALLVNHDEACDFCMAALMVVDRYEHIEKLLEFTTTKKISDDYTIAELSRFRYELATYQLIYGTSKDIYTRNSEWPAFLSSENHIHLFNQFCSQCKIAEARILCKRYPAVLSTYLSTTYVIGNLLDSFIASITEDPKTHVDISSFLENDLMSCFLFNNFNSEDIITNSNKLFTFLLDISGMLERIQPKKFPENSLFFAETFQRGMQLMQKNSQTFEQNIELVHTMKLINMGSFDKELPIGRLNVFVRNVTLLVRIHRVYQCPIGYSEFLNCDVKSICYRILDRVRTATSVRDHIKRFVFPYMEENKLDKNNLLHDYIKQLANAFQRCTTQYSNSWDQLCLQIAENIDDIGLRYMAIIQIAYGSTPPWSEQLMGVVRKALSNVDNVDPNLVQELRAECMRAELGHIFISYHIPLSLRTVIVDAMNLKGILQFIFRNSDKEPATKLADTFKILSIYENLKGCPLISRIECYRLYAISIITQLTDEHELGELVDFFNLIKTADDREKVAWQLVYYFKCLLTKTSVLKITREQRMIWLSCALCVVERFVPQTEEANAIAAKFRNIRQLQSNYGLIIDFHDLQNGNGCIQHLLKFITDGTKKSMIEALNFGYLFSLSLREIFSVIVDAQMKNNLTESSMNSLEFFVQRESQPHLSDLDLCLTVCESTLWNIRTAAMESGTELEPLTRIVHIFKSTLPTLLDWSTSLQSIAHVELFCKIQTYISLLDNIIQQCVVDSASVLSNRMESTDELRSAKDSLYKIYTNRRRIGTFLPCSEGSFADQTAIIRNASLVASSVIHSLPAEREENIYYGELRDNWADLYKSLSTHAFLEIFSRQFSYFLPCFSTAQDKMAQDQLPLAPLKRCVFELLKKILSVATADLPLAAHLLLRLAPLDMKMTLQDLRRWVTSSRKNVRVALNVIRLSLFVLLEIKDYGLQAQITSYFESTLWQKRFTKLGMFVDMKNLRKDNAFNLLEDFVKVLVPPFVLKQFYQEMQVSAELMLRYAIELCKMSSNVVKDRSRFAQTIEAAKAAFAEVNVDEHAVTEVMSLIDHLCPYNYEIIELVLKQLNEWCEALNLRASHGAWIFDRLFLIDSLKLLKREKGYTNEETSWYRAHVNKNGRTMDESSLMRSGFHEEPSSADADLSVEEESMHNMFEEFYQKSYGFEAVFPPSSVDRLPFHVFLLDGEDIVKKYLQPIIFHEINIFNVLKWTYLIRETTTILKISKTILVVNAIQNDLCDAMKYNREFDRNGLNQIHRLMHMSCRKASVIKALMHKFRKLQLCQIKISIFQICCEVVDEWIKDGQEGDDDYTTLQMPLKATLAQLTTELILKRNNLLNSNTAALSQNAVSLISYICSNCVDWNNDVNIDSHFKIVEEIARVNEVNLNEIYDELILNWLPGNDFIEMGHMVHSDPDATIDFMSGGGEAMPSAGSSASWQDIDMPLATFYDDVSLTKIVYLLRKCDPEQKARFLYNKYNQENASNMVKIRAACCLIRFLTNEQMHTILQMSMDDFLLGLKNIFVK